MHFSMPSHSDHETGHAQPLAWTRQATVAVVLLLGVQLVDLVAHTLFEGGPAWLPLVTAIASAISLVAIVGALVLAHRSTRELIAVLRERDSLEALDAARIASLNDRVASTTSAHQALVGAMAERNREFEEALRAREALESFSQTMTDNQPNLLAYIDAGGRVRFANRAYMAWSERPRGEVIGHRLPTPADPEALARRNELVRRVMAGEAIEIAQAMRDGPGGPRHFWTHRIPDVQGETVRGYFFIATDITELHRAQQELEGLNDALEQADSFARMIADNIPGRVVYWDHEMRCRFVNRVFCEWYGVIREEILGRPAREIVGERIFSELEARCLAALGGEAMQFDHQETDPSGHPATVLIHFVPDVAGNEVRGIFTLVLDVTQRRIADAALRRLNEELVQARDKAEAAGTAKTSFLANMSHEIRTPMNAIIGLTHLMRRESQDPHLKDRLSSVGEAADHLLEIINKVLDLSKIEAGKLVIEPSDFSVDELIKRSINLVAQAAADKGLTLAWDMSNLPDWIHSDVTRLSQALVNLLGNAVKFTDHGGVRLNGRLVEQQGRDLLLRFEVSDTGVGIPPERIEQVFDAFEQADGSTTRRFGGTGLGLNITRHLARLLGGDAGACSEPGAGSTFWITIRAQAVAEGAETISSAFDLLAEEAIRERHEGARILLAEDHVINQEVATTLLELAGLRVDVAENGVVALEMAFTQSYDLVLMDVQMPELDGLQATRMLRADPRTASLPIIAMTANAYAEDRAACMASGMNDHLAKPVVPSVLYEVLSRWLPRSKAPAEVVNRERAGEGAETGASASDASPEFDSIEGLNTERGLAFFAGSVDVYRRGLRQFASLYAVEPAAFTAYRTEAGAGQGNRLARELHAIAGAGAAIGGLRLSELSRRAEWLVQQSAPATDVIVALDAVTGHIAQLVEGINGSLADASV